MIFEVQVSLFGAKNTSKIGSESHLRRGSSQKASWKPLGTLLEASGAEKKILGAALGRSKRNLKTGFNYLGDQSAPKTEPGSVENRVPEATRVANGETTKL